MTLDLDKSTWKRVRLADVIRRSREQVDPLTGSVERYVAGGHIDSDGLMIERWGDVGDGQMGSTFRYVFRPGQVLFVSARPYLKKTGIPQFSGVVADKTYVLDAVPENGLSQEFLPFVLSSERFVKFATAEATGSMNPRLLWGAMQRYEFDLPPLNEQKRLGDLVWAAEQHRLAVSHLDNSNSRAQAKWSEDLLEDLDWSMPLSEALHPTRPLCYGVVQPGNDPESGVGLIRVMDLESGEPKRDSLKKISRKVDQQYRRSRVAKGDVLVSIVGTIGRTWVVTDAFQGCNIARALARLSPDESVILPQFLSWVLASKSLQAALENAAFESARKTLNLSVLSSIKLPRIAVDDQRQILHINNQFVGGRTTLKQEASANAALRASILGEIFGGGA